MRRAITCILWTASAGAWIGTAQAVIQGRPAAGRDAGLLRGLQGVFVAVEPIGSEARRDGLDEGHTRHLVEDRLRKAGIPVLTAEERNLVPGSPCLYVRIGAVKHPNDLYAYSTQILLAEQVRLQRDPSVRTAATTWHAGGVGPIGRRYLRNAVRQSVEDKVDQFIRDYLAANPGNTVVRP